MYILKIAKAIKTISINEIKDVIFENYHKPTELTKKISYNSIKSLTKKYFLTN